ncbi:hypothetical protein C7M84_019337 [Penaeus vannamei]|uniref:Carboxylesterase type B domain-containing protein n=1 Tax=Penaeus vannamei TaxID=6689 RepID=A0A423SF02_PENVA|nr:hypothetical protein C7M84_019337 [Penaeus vannamei]
MYMLDTTRPFLSWFTLADKPRRRHPAPLAAQWSHHGREGAADRPRCPQVRRGMLGFLPHPRLAASTYPHTSGNQGVSDLLTALKWVQRNVEHFGGDPGRITLLGHQAGAAMAWPLLFLVSGPSPDPLRLDHRHGAAPPGILVAGGRPRAGGVAQLLHSPVPRNHSGPQRDGGALARVPPPLRPPVLLADGLVVPFIPSKPQVPVMIGKSPLSTMSTAGLLV